MSEKEQAAAAILRAKAELEEALWALEKMPAFDPGTIAFSAHAHCFTFIDYRKQPGTSFISISPGTRN